MKMVRRIAFQNMKYHKNRNILIGIVIFLTTLLVFLVPSVGRGMIVSQFAAVNEIYPSYHALFRDIDADTAKKLSVYHGIKNWGLRSDVGIMAVKDAEITLHYVDKGGFLLNNLKLAEGAMPARGNEIVVSRGILKALGQSARIGDTIMVPCQIYRGGGLDHTEEKEFVVTGFFEDGAEDSGQKKYASFVSEDFLKSEIPEDEIRYRFFLQAAAEENNTTDQMKQAVSKIGERFHIPEKDIRINEDYLMANYVDPVMLPVILGIVGIIAFAGVITIYSIYYVGISDRVREFGKIKAMGASRKQLKKIILWEGLSVAAIAVPAGLLAGTILTRGVFTVMLRLFSAGNILVSTILELMEAGKISLCYFPIYALAVFVSFLTVRLGLQKSMRVVSRISEMEAIRYQGEEGKSKRTKGERKSRKEITLPGLSVIYLLGKKKNTLITIIAMSVTGIFVMVVATVLSCANPKDSADNSILGQYEISLAVEFDNKEHPERQWGSIIRNNPLTEELRQEVLKVEGVTDAVCFLEGYVSSQIFEEGERWGITGVPESYMERLLDGITEGEVTEEELNSGACCILDKNLLYWYPDIRVGDRIKFEILDEENHQVELKVGAIGDYDSGFSYYNYFLMGEEGMRKLCQGSLEGRMVISARESYSQETQDALVRLVEENELLQMRTWKVEYDNWKKNLAITTGGAYAFLGILGMICLLNMVNTMVHSVHLRKREIGMMQAMGMSDGQLVKMLQLEGLFYTAGTLLISIGIGGIAGYPVFRLAKAQGWFAIRHYHYPLAAAVVVSLVLLAVQMILAAVLGRSVKKESLIERIRYSE